MVVEDLIPLDMLPVLPTAVIKMCGIASSRRRQLLSPKKRLD